MATYLVTGSAGFIGAALSNKLISDGHNVFGIDNLSTGFNENVPGEVIFFKGDCQDESIYRKLEKEHFDAIFHIAGQSSGEISFDNPSYDLRTNTESTLHLLKFALKTGCKRFIYASTMSVYGIKPDQPVNETATTLPTSFYGVGKLASEHYLRLFGQYGIQTTSLRLFNVYGSGQNMQNLRQGMVSIYLAQLLNDNHIHIKGSPDRYRDFIYIDDVVDAFISCLTAPESIGEKINIGAGVRTTVSVLITQLISLFPQHISIEYSGCTPGDLHGIYANISLAKDLISFKPKITLKEGLRLFVNSVKLNKTIS
jgi:UDP-glucose 4-epimerase